MIIPSIARTGGAGRRPNHPRKRGHAPSLPNAGRGTETEKSVAGGLDLGQIASTDLREADQESIVEETLGSDVETHETAVIAIEAAVEAAEMTAIARGKRMYPRDCRLLRDAL